MLPELAKKEQNVYLVQQKRNVPFPCQIYFK